MTLIPALFLFASLAYALALFVAPSAPIYQHPASTTPFIPPPPSLPPLPSLNVVPPAAAVASASSSPILPPPPAPTQQQEQLPQQPSNFTFALPPSLPGAPCLTSVNGLPALDCTGNTLLPSGRRIHAYANVVGSVVDIGQVGGSPFYRRVTVRSDSPSGVGGSNPTPQLQSPLPPSAVFLALEAPTYEGAFIHWFSECATQIHLHWAELKAIHPGLKLLLMHQRGFKRSILEAMGVSKEDVVEAVGFFEDPASPATLDTPFESPSNPPPLNSSHAFPHSTSNLVYFPLTVYQGMEEGVFMGPYIALVEHLRGAVAGLPPCHTQREPTPTSALDHYLDFSVLCVARREGFASNEIVHYKDLPQFCASLTQSFKATTVYPEDFATLGEELRAFDAARIIVTNYGSAMFFQGSFARNSTVIAMGMCFGHEDFGNLRHIFHYAQRFNTMLIVCTNMGILPEEAVGASVENKVVSTIVKLWESRERPMYSCP